MMVSTSANVPMRTREKPNLDRMAKRVQNLFKIGPDGLRARLAITKSIIELTGLSKNCELVKKRSIEADRFSDDAVVFYENKQHDLPSNHNRLLYITASVNEVELKRAMLDSRASINIISLAV